MNSRFPSVFYKLILRNLENEADDVPLEELREWDFSLYKSFLKMVDPSVTLAELGLEDMLTFTVEKKILDCRVEVELIENGKNVTVTDENKAEYVRLILNYKLRDNIKSQVIIRFS